MPKIRRDELGLYVPVGWRGRPTKATGFPEGQDVKARHHGGSTLVTVQARDGTLGETWCTGGCPLDFRDLDRALKRGWLTDVEYREMIHRTGLFSMFCASHPHTPDRSLYPGWEDWMLECSPGSRGVALSERRREILAGLRSNG